MTPADRLKQARQATGLSQADFGLALGYQHANRYHTRVQVNDMEHGRKTVTPMVARLAEMFRRFGVPPDFVTDSSE
jgi:transcriptional regulator with XRE-family HTH domain